MDMMDSDDVSVWSGDEDDDGMEAFGPINPNNPGMGSDLSGFQF